MDIRQRRDLLTTRRNPDSKIDYVASMDGHMAVGDEVKQRICFGSKELLAEGAN